MSDKKPIIIANWKMKLGLEESRELARQVIVKSGRRAEVVLCPSFTSLSEVGKLIKKSEVRLGGQDCFWEDSGAFTGEVSPIQLKDLGAEFVIIGHSERRSNLNETDEMVHRKVEAAIAAGLIPVICVGETFDERQEGTRDFILVQQVTRALEGLMLKDHHRLMIAYEPVWVIGSGQAVEPADAGAAAEVIRQVLIDLFSPDSVNNYFSILYGGSVNENNVSDFTDQDNIDGILVGGASLKAAEFISLIRKV